MPDAREDARNQYSKTRAEFEKLGTQDKTAFVLDATFATIGQAIEDTGRQFADILERVANYDFGAYDAPEPSRANPAAPPSAKSRASAKKRATPNPADEDAA